MNFKSSAWKRILELSEKKENHLRARVEYTEADLYLENSEKIKYDAPTTIVALWQDRNRFIGVAQCSDRDSYSKEKGREIAAGRALKQFEKWVQNPARNPNDVWETEEGQQAIIFGSIPTSVEDIISNTMVFE